MSNNETRESTSNTNHIETYIDLSNAVVRGLSEQARSDEDDSTMRGAMIAAGNLASSIDYIQQLSPEAQQRIAEKLGAFGVAAAATTEHISSVKASDVFAVITETAIPRSTVPVAGMLMDNPGVYFTREQLIDKVSPSVETTPARYNAIAVMLREIQQSRFSTSLDALREGKLKSYSWIQPEAESTPVAEPEVVVEETPEIQTTQEPIPSTTQPAMPAVAPKDIMSAAKRQAKARAEVEAATRKTEAEIEAASTPEDADILLAKELFDDPSIDFARSEAGKLSIYRDSIQIKVDPVLAELLVKVASANRDGGCTRLDLIQHFKEAEGLTKYERVRHTKQLHSFISNDLPNLVTDLSPNLALQTVQDPEIRRVERIGGWAQKTNVNRVGQQIQIVRIEAGE